MLIYLIIAISLALLLYPSIQRLIDRKYENFVQEHSLALKKLKELNNKYHFHIITDCNLKHSYDNLNFYIDISPKDYLIYQLIYIEKNIRQSIAKTYENRTLYRLYQEDVQYSCIRNQYDTTSIPKNMVKLSEIETKILDMEMITPDLDFQIQVSLYNTNIYGQVYSKKSDTFTIPEIENILKLLNQKSGDFYLNHDIWKSICRVERGKVSNKMRFAIYQRDHYRCQKCGFTSDKTNELEIDHIFPIAKGGKSNFDNLQTLCHKCNALKADTVESGAINPKSQKNGITEVCNICGAPLVLRNGKYGQFYGCSNYPKCKFTKNISVNKTMSKTQKGEHS